MPKPTPKNNKTLYIKIVRIILAIPAGLFILFWLFAFQVPQYSYYYMKCGFQQPVKVIKDRGSSMQGFYTMPGSPDYAQTGIFVNEYYCTENEAQQNGNIRR